MLKCKQQGNKQKQNQLRKRLYGINRLPYRVNVCHKQAGKQDIQTNFSFHNITSLEGLSAIREME